MSVQLLHGWILPAWMKNANIQGYNDLIQQAISFSEVNMRIGMMADLYKPHISGVTNYISLNKTYLESQGHEVFVFTFGDEQYHDDEPRVIRSPGLPLLSTGYIFGFRYSTQARKLLRSMDVVHVHHPFLTGSLALRYCRPRGIPIVFTNHTRYDLYAQAYAPGMPEAISMTALQAYMPVFCRACDLVISPSAGMREVLQRFGVDVPVEVVPNGVDLKPFRQPIQPRERAEFGFKAEDVVLVYLGRLGPEKNLPFLLRSFAGTLQAYEQARLMIIGDGPERENLEERVKQMGLDNYVRFTGQIPYDQVPKYITVADVFATASVTEVHPFSVIEAMAAGLPVLGIQSPGVGDTVQDGETGYLAPETDLASFTAKMVRLVMDHNSRRKMGAQARQAAEEYAIERTTQIVLGHYQRVIHLAASRTKSPRARITRWMDGFKR
jgi:glycosyltransferase involved in cell wall biosynthesis